MSRRKKKRILPGLSAIIISIGVIAGREITAYKMLPEFVGTTREAVTQAVEESVPFSEVIPADHEVADGYYYQHLSGEEQTVYKEILQGVRETADSIYLHSADADRIGEIYGFLLCDRPELFWCTGEMQITSYSEYSEVRPVYTYEGEERDARQAEIDAAAEQCLAGIGAEASEYDRVKYIFEYLVNTVDYNMDAPDNQNIYSALVNRASVCAGYSRAAQYLLQRMGVECIYVIGTIPEQGAHAWNIVNCGGQYYQLDVTFGDPVFLQEESGAAIPESSINYGYLCCSDEELLRNHVPDTKVEYPACTSMELNYYVLNGRYYDTYDSWALLENMNQSIYNMESFFTCKFADDALYQQAHDDIINNLFPQAAQNLAAYYGLEWVQYTYVEDDVMDVITVYWSYQ